MNTDLQLNNNSEDSVDILSLVMRHALLLAASIVGAMILGVIYYLNASPTYQSSTLAVIETRRAPVFSEVSANEHFYSTKIKTQTHASLIPSTMIVERAIELGALNELDLFKEMERKHVKSEPMEPFNLARTLTKDIEVDIPEEFSPIVEVSYQCRDAEACRLVVSSVAEAYATYLNEKSEGLSKEITGLIIEAKDDLRDELESLEREYAEFRKTAPVLWKEGVAVNIHQERQVDLERKRKELVIERATLASKIRRLSSSIAEGGPAKEAVHFEGMTELQRNDYSESGRQRRSEITSSALSQGLSTEYVELTRKEGELSEQFGDGHPDLNAIRTRLVTLRRSLKAAIKADLEASEIGSLQGETDYGSIYVRVLEDRAASVDDQLKTLQTTFEQEEVASEGIQVHMAREQELRMQIERTQQVFDAVVARMDEINIIQDYEGDRISIFEPAQKGKRQSPTLIKTAALSLFAGMLLGGALALRLETRDLSFSSPQQVRAIVGAPVLAQIPKFDPAPATSGAVSSTICVHHRPKSRSAEAFRGIRNALFYSSARQDLKVIQVTSPLPGDGKSTLISNLAAAIASSDRSVVLVDADCRRPMIHKLFGMEQGDGLVEVLSGDCDLDDAVTTTEVENLFVVRSGAIPPNPSELITSPKFDSVLASLRESFDFVLVDTPPVLAVSDGCAVAAKVDGVVLVLRLSGRARPTAERVRQSLVDVEANVVGVVVNAVGKGAKGGYKSDDYSYSYGYGYGAYGKEYAEYYEKPDDDPEKPHTTGNGSLRHADV